MYAVTQLFDKEGNMETIFFTGIVCIILIVIAVTDARQKKISEYTFGSFVCSCDIFRSCLYGNDVERQNCGRSSVSAILLAVTWIRRGAFGAGDVKLMAVSGLLLGTGKNLTAFLFAVVIAAAYCLPGIILGDRKSTSEIAFGPFLCMRMPLSFGREIYTVVYELNDKEKTDR